ncbi:MAG: hypothetical protein V1736_01135 [Pseudomonadota bacterium]
MKANSVQQKKGKLNIQISPETKNRLYRISALQKKKVSVLVRESIEEKLNEIERKMFEEDMKRAYQDLARENLEVSEDFKFVDAENIR